MSNCKRNNSFQQECIPVGCVPSAIVDVCGGRGGIPACTEADPPAPRGQTDGCKNITFATHSPKKRHSFCFGPRSCGAMTRGLHSRFYHHALCRDLCISVDVFMYKKTKFYPPSKNMLIVCKNKIKYIITFYLFI